MSYWRFLPRDVWLSPGNDTRHVMGSSVVDFEERESPRTNLQVLVLVLSSIKSLITLLRYRTL